MLGDRPGLGLEFDEAALDRMAADLPAAGSRVMLWGRRRGAGLFMVGPNEPEWPEE